MTSVARSPKVISDGFLVGVTAVALGAGSVLELDGSVAA